MRYAALEVQSVMQIAELQGHRRSTTTASGPVSYLDVGGGRAAVFIYGLLANGLLWRHVISAVASEQRRCIAVDLPGHGHTPPAMEGGDVSLTGLAHRVLELIDQLGLTRFWWPMTPAAQSHKLSRRTRGTGFPR